MTGRPVPLRVPTSLLRIAAILLATLCVAPAARAQTETRPGAPAPAAGEPAVLPASGGDGHGWFALPGQSGFAFPTLYHLPPDAEPGTVRGGPRLLDFPEAIASHADRVVLVMPPERVDPPHTGGAGAGGGEAAQQAGARNDAPARLIRRVQTLRVARSAASGMWSYYPEGRSPIALPSLPGRGDLRAVVKTDAALFALLAAAPADAVRTGFDAPREDALLTLADGSLEWRRRTLPPDWREGAPAAMVVVGERVVLLQPGRSWHAETDALARADALWSDAGVRADVDGAIIVSAGSSIVSARPEADRVALHLLREDTRIELPAVMHAAEQLAVIGGAEAITVVWRGEGEPNRLRTTVVSAISGAVLYDDFARTNAVVSGREIQSLALLVGALMLTILVFVLRPEEALGGVVMIPEGYALASPARRVLAVLLDLAPPLVGCSALFGVSGAELLDAAVLSDNSTTRAAAALGVAFLLTGAHSVLGEWLFGRTFGKALLRCRTITVRGERPRLWQASMRTFVKLLFPPFVLFLFLDLRRRHPGDLVAGTVVLQRRRRGPVEPPADAGSPPPSS